MIHEEKDFLIYGSHLKNLCLNLFTLRWKSVIAGPCQVRPQVFRFGNTFANQQNIKDAVVLGWGRQLLEKSSQIIEIAAVTANVAFIIIPLNFEVSKVFMAIAWSTIKIWLNA